MKTYLKMAVAAAFALATISVTTDAEASHRRAGIHQHHSHHIGHRRGRHGRFVCGLTQRLHFHITDPRYNYSYAWKDFESTYARKDAVVIQSRRGKASDGRLPGGHVSRIVEVLDECHAMVADEKGVYKRDICRNRVGIVMPPSG